MRAPVVASSFGFIALGLACGGASETLGGPVAVHRARGVDQASEPAPEPGPTVPPCVAACRDKRAIEATEGEVLDAECDAACGVGDGVVRLKAEPGFAVVRGKLDVADLPAPDGLPLPIAFGLHVDGGLVGLSCETGEWGGLLGRQVWVRGYLLEGRPDFEDGMMFLRDCQGLALVDAP
jgi:hypothetical protein